VRWPPAWEVSEWSGVEWSELVGWLVGWLVGELEGCCGSVLLSCRCLELVAEAWDNSGTQRKGNSHRWMPLPNNW
jgi:hypothetical protein